MNATPRQILTHAMKTLQAIGQEEVPTAAELQDGLALLNQWIDAAKIDRLYILQVVRTLYTLSAGVASYTIGATGDFAAHRPQWIDKARVLPTAGDDHEYPVDVFNLDRFARLTHKTASGAYPTVLYYDHGYDTDGLGTVTVHPVPTPAGVRLALYVPTPLDVFADADDERDLPPGYYRLLRLAMALEVAPSLAAVDPNTLAVISKQYTDARAAVQAANLPEPELGMDDAIAGRRTRFDINAGDYL